MRIGLILLVIASPLLVGCTSNQFKEPTPITHPVAGVVIRADGQPFAKGGAITFQHDDESKRGVTTTGLIKSDDGSFTLQSVTAQHNVPGAQEGSYRVTILPSSVEQRAGPILLKKKYVVEPGDNKLTIRLEH